MEPDKPQDIQLPPSGRKKDSELFARTDKNHPPVNSHPVFVVDDTFFRSRTPKSPHWSIAWADLMMTMFVLFLTLFVYQLAHREFLSKETPEVVAGTVMPVPQKPSTALPFYPISPAISDKQADQVKKLEPVPVAEVDVDVLFEGVDAPAIEEPVPLEQISPDMEDQAPGEIQPEVAESGTAAGVAEIPLEQPQPDQETQDNALIAKMYDLSKVTLASEKLEKFASVELIPDKTMRIILTGDLLFESGQAQLTKKAKKSLHKLLPIIEQTPYMINVIGHTDSIPMHSQKFASNWELSTARAAQVAQFLIEEGRIPARQFVVSGYSYFRPVKPNTTAANRKANRRVEIILSKEPAPAQPATETNIQ